MRNITSGGPLVRALSAVVVAFVTAQVCGQEIAKLTPDDAAAMDAFGSSVAMDGDTLLVGAQGNADEGDSSGAVYVFSPDGDGWSQSARLEADDGEIGDGFGASVAIDGDTVVVGALYHTPAGGTRSGAAYIFRREAGVWTQAAKLVPGNPIFGQAFGESVSISGGTIVVGASGDNPLGLSSGSAYIYREVAGQWSFVTRITASDGNGFDRFGNSVSISGDTILVGAWQDDDAGSSTGSAYIFGEAAGVWTEITKLTADVPTAFDSFGGSVSISGDTCVVGVRGGGSSGEAYVFREVGGVWEREVVLTDPDAVGGEQFGSSVAIAGDLIAVGAWASEESGNDWSGAAHIFVRSDAWEHIRKLTASDPEAFDELGASIAVGPDLVLAGAPGVDDAGDRSGAAYVFAANGPPCDADLNGDGVLDFFDVQAYLNLYSGGDPAADLNDDGALDFFDVQGYLAAFAAGCP